MGYTLYKNYQTDFPFKEFILFLETINFDYLNNNLKVFSFFNFTESNQKIGHLKITKNSCYKDESLWLQK